MVPNAILFSLKMGYLTVYNEFIRNRKNTKTHENKNKEDIEMALFSFKKKSK